MKAEFIDNGFNPPRPAPAEAPDLKRITKQKLYQRLMAERKTLDLCNADLKVALGKLAAFADVDTGLSLDAERLAATNGRIALLEEGNDRLTALLAEKNRRIDEILDANTNYLEEARTARRKLRRQTFDVAVNSLIQNLTFLLLIFGLLFEGCRFLHLIP